MLETFNCECQSVDCGTNLQTFSDMSADTLKGEISQKLNVDCSIEWSVQDIFSDRVPDESNYSPTFSIPGSEWYLHMYPNGETKYDSVGWIGLYFLRGSESTPPISVKYDFGVKKVDGTIEVIRKDMSNVFDKKDCGWGISKLLKRSRLLERKSEWAPSGALTVTCTMRVKDDMDCSTQRLIELSGNLKNMFVSARGCDATLKVQDREFPVHKSLLASRSSVFERMFEVDMKEKSTGIVDIVDCDPEAFHDFLVYVYSGQFQISSVDAFEVYKIAHRYCTEELKSACVRSILSNLSVDNVIDVAILGDQFDENELKNRAQDFFNKNFKAVIATDKWKSLLRQKPSLVDQLLNSMAQNTEITIKRCCPC